MKLFKIPSTDPIFVRLSVITILLTLFAWNSWSQNFKHSELLDKNYDELNIEVEKAITRAKKTLAKGQKDDDEEEAIIEANRELKVALKMILSRPDNDNMISKLAPSLKKELTALGSYESALREIVEEAMETIKNKSAPMVYRSTAVFVLENAMSEIKPSAHQNLELRAIIAKVKESKMEVPEEVVNDRKMGSMFRKNPELYKVAEQILKDSEKLMVKAKPKAETDKSDEDVEKSKTKPKKVIGDDYYQ